MVKIVQSSSAFIELPAVLKNEVVGYLNGKEIALLLSTSKNGVKKDAAMQQKIDESKKAQELRDSKIAESCESLARTAEALSSHSFRKFYTKANHVLATIGALGSAINDPLRGAVLGVCCNFFPYVFELRKDEMVSSRIISIAMNTVFTAMAAGLAPSPIQAVSIGSICYHSYKASRQA